MTKPGSGLRGKDKQQGTLRDERNGTYVSTHTNRPGSLLRDLCGRGWDRTASTGDEAEPGSLGNQR
jgi:hypothetical protein